jgi:5-methylcytosine-specific restriction enzyme subunit McrC
MFVFADIPLSTNVRKDLSAVKLDRGMSYYKVPYEWTKLVLDGFSPLTMQGNSYALSLLFPLEAVFESYVASVLLTLLPEHMSLDTQVKTKSLALFNKRKFFQLRPDLFITNKQSTNVVLDTKWKLIDSTKDNGTDKFGLSQSDLYQMFAYGHKYLDGSGELFLIYPSHDDFQEPIEHSFDFYENKSLVLWVVPFDISAELSDDDRVIWPELSCLKGM